MQRRDALALLTLVTVGVVLGFALQRRFLVPSTAPPPEFRDGEDVVRRYLEADTAFREGRRERQVERLIEAQQEFVAWAERRKPRVVDVLQLFERVIPEVLPIVKSGLHYVRLPPGKGGPFEYTVLLPEGYDPHGPPLPLVLSLHGRVVDPRHPAFRDADFTERSRVVVCDHWLGTAAAREAIIIAPTSSPHGFFVRRERSDADLRLAYRALGEALTNYRVDWNRVFLDIEVAGVRFAMSQPSLFAGIVLRDRAADPGPPFPPERLSLLDNLGGVPMLYLADPDHWTNVGRRLADGRREYSRGPVRLRVVKGALDERGRLRGAEEMVREFIVGNRRHPATDFEWRFDDPSLESPAPVGMRGVSYDTGPGHLRFACRDNRLEIEVTNAESLWVYLSEELVDFDRPLTVVVNGRVARDRIELRRDWAFFLENVAPRRFFMIPYLAKLELRVPGKQDGDD